LISSIQTDLNRNLFIHKIENQDSFSSSSVLENYVSLNSHSISVLPQLIPTLITPCPSTLFVTQNVTAGQDNKQAANSIEATNSISGSSTSAIYHAGNFVLLKPPFNVIAGAKLHAYIAGCTGTFLARQSQNNVTQIDKNVIKEVTKEDKVIISPNPNNGVFKIALSDLKEGTIQITDLYGITVFKTNFINQLDIEINLQDKPKGIYLVKTISGEKIFTGKIIKN
jgi:Secretion system C-terminal sorting domain